MYKCPQGPFLPVCRRNLGDPSSPQDPGRKKSTGNTMVTVPEPNSADLGASQAREAPGKCAKTTKKSATGSGRETAEIWASRALDKTAGTEKHGEEDGAGPGARILDFWGFPGPKNHKKNPKKIQPPWEVLLLKAPL